LFFFRSKYILFNILTSNTLNQFSGRY
jgi:hypothetical protein